MSFRTKYFTVRDDEKGSPSRASINTVVTVSDVDERIESCDSHIKGGALVRPWAASCCAAEGKSLLPGGMVVQHPSGVINYPDSS